jgi:hypothetical protein
MCLFDGDRREADSGFQGPITRRGLHTALIAWPDARAAFHLASWLPHESVHAPHFRPLAMPAAALLAVTDCPGSTRSAQYRRSEREPVTPGR